MQFVKYTAPGSEEHNPVMLAATAMNPRYKVLLHPIQVESAKKMLIEMVTIRYYYVVCVC